jgi:hypothetical protein
MHAQNAYIASGNALMTAKVKIEYNVSCAGSGRTYVGLTPEFKGLSVACVTTKISNHKDKDE